MLNLLLSGWTFYFRFPTIEIRKFKEPGILLGGIYQATVFYLLYLSLANILANNEAIFLSLILLSCLTGFFHEDGWADTFDAFGVPKFDRSEETIAHMDKARKDSRLGSFGVCALCFIWIFRYYASFHLQIDAVTFAFVILISRTISLYMSQLEAYRQKGNKRASSSSHLRDISRIHILWLLPLIAISIYLSTPWIAAYYLLAIVISFISLRVLSRRMEFLSGDLIGATIIISEIILGFCWGKNYLSYFIS
jgi:adenosylcobinamide-GDP ribazoletransferase